VYSVANGALLFMGKTEHWLRDYGTGVVELLLQSEALVNNINELDDYGHKNPLF
jgi:hypothetical protein